MGSRYELFLMPGQQEYNSRASKTAKTKRRKEKYQGKKWQSMNEAVTFTKLVRCSKPTDVGQLNIFIYKVRCETTKQNNQELL